MSNDPSPSDNDAEMQFNPPAKPLVPGTGGGEAGVDQGMQVGAQSAQPPQESAVAEGPALDEAAKQEFLWHVHQYLGEYARFGDTKAAFAGAIATALLGALYSAKAYVPLVRTPFSQWSLITWLTAIAGLFLLLSIVLAIATVLPRLRSTDSKGFTFWTNIAAYGKAELLQTSFHSQSARTLNDQLLRHVFDISSNVCVPKYRSVSLCIWALVIGGFLAAAVLLGQPVP